MQKIIDKHLIFIMCAMLLPLDRGPYEPVVAFLIAVISMELAIYYEKEKVFYIIAAIYVLACFACPLLIFFIPVHLYEFIYRKKWWGYGICILYIINSGLFNEWWKIELMSIIVIAASILSYRTEIQIREHREFQLMRDSNEEEKTTMKRRNRELLEKQDYEIKVATLSERNRIAREIHDNVGHMLSRCILQLGALMMVHKKDENIYAQLSSVNKSLDEAMNNIRESVHDLHDESVDMKQSIIGATSEMRKNYNMKVDYDMSDNVPRNVKYAMIAIVKEAMSNITRHSNATNVSVILREHPGFYQLLIEDNGTDIRKNMNPGIGLKNMQERVESLGGSINFKTDSGFSILVSIKKEMKYESNSSR